MLISGGSTNKRHLLSHLVLRLNIYCLAASRARYDILADSIVFDNVNKKKILPFINYNQKEKNIDNNITTFLQNPSVEVPYRKNSEKDFSYDDCVTVIDENYHKKRDKIVRDNVEKNQLEMESQNSVFSRMDLESNISYSSSTAT